VKKLSPKQRELYKRVDEVLHYIWDPINSRTIPEARDEYESYVPHVFSLLIHDAPEGSIARYLLDTEVKRMGASTSHDSTGHLAEIEELLRDWRDWLFDED